MGYKECPIRYLNQTLRHVGGLPPLENLNISGYNIARLSAIILHAETKDILARIPLQCVNSVNWNKTDPVGEKLVRLGVAVIVENLDVGVCNDYTWRV
jgi:hypothetical protein